MRAILCRQHGGPENLTLANDVPDPEPGEGEVRVRVRAAGVNFADGLMVRGQYQERPPLPFTPGLEVAGEIDAVGPGVASQAGLEPGRRVLAMVDRGGFAERVVARAGDVVPLPEDGGDGRHVMDAVTAAGFAIAYGTAHGALRWRANLAAGETLLVNGAAGGVGLTAVEVGKAIGARVIATARGPDKLAVALEHGADEALDSETPDLAARLKALGAPSDQGGGIDVVFDPVGGAVFEASLRAIAWEGRIVVVGFASGVVPQIPANILLVKNAAALGFYWGSYRRRDPARLRAGFAELFRWHGEGRICPHVSATLPLERAADALRLIAERRSTGKVVLTTDG